MSLFYSVNLKQFRVLLQSCRVISASLQDLNTTEWFPWRGDRAVQAVNAGELSGGQILKSASASQRSVEYSVEVSLWVVLASSPQSRAVFRWSLRSPCGALALSQYRRGPCASACRPCGGVSVWIWTALRLRVALLPGVLPLAARRALPNPAQQKEFLFKTTSIKKSR